MASIIDDQDPFVPVQRDVQEALKTCLSLLASYMRIRSSVFSTSSPELVEARNDLEDKLTDLESELRDLSDSVKAVEADPYQFGLDVVEVEFRRKLVTDIGHEVSNIHTELSKTVQDVQREETQGFGPKHFRSPSSYDDNMEESPEYIQELEVRNIMKKQDHTIDTVMLATVGNLRRQADDLGNELGGQADILAEANTVADRVGGKLRNGITKLNSAVKRNEDKCSSFCISIFIFLLIILLVLVLIV